MCVCVAVLVGSASILLSDVLADPQHWGSKQQVVLTGHKAGAAGTVLEVQLFLAAVSHTSRTVNYKCITVHIT